MSRQTIVDRPTLRKNSVVRHYRNNTSTKTDQRKQGEELNKKNRGLACSWAKFKSWHVWGHVLNPFAIQKEFEGQHYTNKPILHSYCVASGLKKAHSFGMGVTVICCEREDSSIAGGCHCASSPSLSIARLLFLEQSIDL